MGKYNLKDIREDIREVYDVLSHEQNYDEFRDYITNLHKVNKLILCKGRENIVKEGPCIIIANSTGTGRDVIGLIREYDSRRLYGVIPGYLFREDVSIKMAKKALGPKLYNTIDWAAKRLVAPLENIVTAFSERLTAFEMIPMDMDYNGEDRSPYKNVVESMKKHLIPTVDENSGIAIGCDNAVFLFESQRRARISAVQKGRKKETSKYHSYLPRFNNTVANIVSELYNEGIDVPVTPIAFYSSGKWWNPLSKTGMNIGKEIHFSALTQYDDPVAEFTDYLEYTIADLLKDLGVHSKTPFTKP